MGSDLLPQFADFLFQPPSFQGLAHQDSDLVDFIRLGQIVICSLLHGFHRGGDRGVAGDHDDFGVRVELPGALENLHAVHLLHAQVRHYQIKFVLFQFFEGFHAAFQRQDLVAFFL